MISLSSFSPANTNCCFGQEPPNQEELVEEIEKATIQAIATAEKSVVAIARVPIGRAPTDRSQSALLLSPPRDLEDPLNDPNFVPTFYGTGVIVSEEGHLVTCAHILDDPKKNRYYVWLNNKRSYSARLVAKPATTLAADPFSDLAVLKFTPDAPVTPIKYASADGVQKGQFVIALGNPDAVARDGKASASWGIISNVNRAAPSEQENALERKQTIHEFGTLIQTDAATKLSCSGGALVNLKGEMVGLTTAFSATPTKSKAAGFAIPTDKLFRRVVKQLQEGKLPEYGFLGIEPTDLPRFQKQKGLHGARVSTVIAGLPGDLAGLRAGDIIRLIDDKEIFSSIDLFRELSIVEAGTEVSIEVDRFGYEKAAEPQRIKLDATISKKFVATTRPAYTIHPRPLLRGMKVEYLTAIPSGPIQMQPYFYRGGARPKVALLDVQPGSAAWQAGLRPGMAIRSVGGQAIESPDDFTAAVPEKGEIELIYIDHRGNASRVQFGAESQ